MKRFIPLWSCLLMLVIGIPFGFLVDRLLLWLSRWG